MLLLWLSECYWYIFTQAAKPSMIESESITLGSLSYVWAPPLSLSTGSSIEKICNIWAFWLLYYIGRMRGKKNHKFFIRFRTQCWKKIMDENRTIWKPTRVTDIFSLIDLLPCPLKPNLVCWFWKSWNDNLSLNDSALEPGSSYHMLALRNGNENGKMKWKMKIKNGNEKWKCEIKN